MATGRLSKVAGVLELPAGALLDIDPENGVTASGTPLRVTQLVDQASGLAFAPVTNGPELVASHPNLKGRSALFYDATTLEDLSRATVTHAATSWTIYSVHESVTTKTVQVLMDSLLGRLLFYQSTTARLVSHFDGSAKTYGATALGAECLTLRLEDVDPDPNTAEAWRGAGVAVSIGTAAYAANALGSKFVIGNAASLLAQTSEFDGYIARQLVYPSAHSASERAAVWAYLAQEYGV